jgi:hypothetical protein
MPYRAMALVAASVLMLSGSALAQFNLPGVSGSNTSDRMGGGGGGKGAAAKTVRGSAGMRMGAGGGGKGAASKSSTSDRMGGGGGTSTK